MQNPVTSRHGRLPLLSSGRAEAGLLVELRLVSLEHPPGFQCGLLPGPVRGAASWEPSHPIPEPQSERPGAAAALGSWRSVLSLLPLQQVSSRWLLRSKELGV